MTSRVLWASVLALLLLSGPGAAAGSRAQTVSSIPPFVWTLTAFPGVGAVVESLYTVQFLAAARSPSARTAIGREAPGAGGTVRSRLR